MVQFIIQQILGKLYLIFCLSLTHSHSLSHILTHFHSFSNTLSFYSHAGYGVITGGTCQVCSAGYFSQEGATTPCLISPVGYYSSQQAAAPTICDSDTIAPYAGMSSCTACPIGQIASVGSTSCGFCGVGTYKSSINTCTSCLNIGMATCNRIDGSGVSWYVVILNLMTIFSSEILFK